MTAAWPDVEEALERSITLEADFDPRFRDLARAVRQAFRVEAVVYQGALVTEFQFHVLFASEHPESRKAASTADQNRFQLDSIVSSKTPGWFVETKVRLVPAGRPLQGEACPRIMLSPEQTPNIEDVPVRKPSSNVPLEEVDGHWLTPIEVPFYREMKKTDLVFAVQPWVEGPDRRYRPDFIVYWRGRGIVVELDGHEGHKTKDQRSKDAQRERWFKQKGLSTIRWTGSDVHRDAAACVGELLTTLRQSGATA